MNSQYCTEFQHGSSTQQEVRTYNTSEVNAIVLNGVVYIVQSYDVLDMCKVIVM